ncbi:fimbrial usher protein StbD [Rahnella inusitata]|uniref:fimbrial usher protein StbD n=1 Tax=Rahnella inusitata TaxID=58169 RepID=UPI0039AF4FEE
MGVVLLSSPLFSQANCTRVTSTSSLTTELINEGYTASSWTGACHNACGGNIGLPPIVSISSSSSFTPAGSLLASSTANFLTASQAKAYTENQILFRCALADAGSLSEIYTTQSYSAYSGMYETTDIEGAYHTYVNNVAIRLTNLKTGNYFTGRWQSRLLTSDDWVQDDTYIYIPASAFSDVYVELLRTSSTAITGISTSPYLYAWGYNSGFIGFRGPGLASAGVVDGVLEGGNYYGWYENYPGSFGMYGHVTFVRGAMCLVKDYPSVVLLPTISTASLNNGETSQSTFDISLSCEDAAISSVSKSTSSSANVAMGFLVNQSTAVTAATTLGLTSTNGLTHLLDTNYGSSGVASGVGIRIYDQNGNVLNLLSSKTMTTGNDGGWYAYKDLTTSQDDSTDGVTTYTGNFTASLEAISGETVTAGSVNAQLQVVVSFQ